MDYLFHYTTIDVLELILKNRTIRFNALFKMDDWQEQYSAHGPAQGRHYFISSWTSQEAENPRMWREYCRPDPSRGVRLKLAVNPFSKTENNLQFPVPSEMALMHKNRMKIEQAIFRCYPEVRQDAFAGFDGLMAFRRYKEKLLKEHPDIARRLIADSEEAQRNFTITNNWDVDKLLHSVQYTDDPTKLFPTMYHKYENQLFGTFQDFCLHKNTSWAWQSEWRYILSFHRMRAFRRKKDNALQWYDVPFDHYDLKLDPVKLAKLEITTSPNISADAADKLRTLLEQHLPTATVKESTLSPV